jgi:lipoprotein-anchoring transpeptidase ErfK/SrfK
MTGRRPWSRSRGIRLGVVAGLAVLAIGGPGVAPASATTAAAPRPLVVLLGDHVARRAPNADAGRIEAVAARRPLTRSRTVLPVLGHGGRDDAWLRVMLPGRPNGHTGWISAGRTRSTSTPWRIVVSLSVRRVIVYRDGRVVRRFPAIVGKPSTPTPRGTFFVEEALRLSPGAPGAPFALATSARSDVLQEFDGGPGQIALHGTGNLSGTLGTAASHGCVRLAPHAIAWLASRIGAGVPVSIRLKKRARHASRSHSRSPALTDESAKRAYPRFSKTIR